MSTVSPAAADQKRGNRGGAELKMTSTTARSVWATCDEPEVRRCHAGGPLFSPQQFLLANPPGTCTIQPNYSCFTTCIGRYDSVCGNSPRHETRHHAPTILCFRWKSLQTMHRCRSGDSLTWAMTTANQVRHVCIFEELLWKSDLGHTLPDESCDLEVLGCTSRDNHSLFSYSQALTHA